MRLEAGRPTDWIAGFIAISLACQPSRGGKEDQVSDGAAPAASALGAPSAGENAATAFAPSSSSVDSGVATPIAIEQGLLAIRSWQGRAYWIADTGAITRLYVSDASDSSHNAPRSFEVKVSHARTFTVAPFGLVWLTDDALLTSDLEGRGVRVLARGLPVDKHSAVAVDGEQIYYTNGAHIRRATWSSGNDVTIGSAWDDLGVFGESTPTAIAVLAGAVYWLVNDRLMTLRAIRFVPFGAIRGSYLRFLASIGDSLIYSDSEGIHGVLLAARKDTLLVPHRPSAIAAKGHAVYFASTGRHVNQLLKLNVLTMEKQAIASFEGEASDIAIGDNDVHWIAPATGRVYRARE